MREILTNAKAHRQDDIEIFFPGLSMEELQKIVEFLYTGQVKTSTATLKQLTDLLKILGFEDMVLEIAIPKFSTMEAKSEVNTLLVENKIFPFKSTNFNRFMTLAISNLFVSTL